MCPIWRTICIAKLPFLLNNLDIPIKTNTRLFICTDNEITFKGTLTHNSHGTFPDLLNRIKYICKREHTTLIKVKGHITPPIYGNAIADLLAEEARKFSHNARQPLPTPDLENIYLNSNLFYCYVSCSRLTTSWKQFDVG